MGWIVGAEKHGKSRVEKGASSEHSFYEYSWPYTVWASSFRDVESLKELLDALFCYLNFWHVIFMFWEKICEIFAEGREFYWYLLRENRVDVATQEISYF